MLRPVCEIETYCIKMAEGGSDEIIDKQICGLCLGTYMKEPKLLSCFHSFCLKCLENYVNENVQHNKFQCPLCNDSIDLPVGGVMNFEANIYIDIEALSNVKHQCDFCGPDLDATNHCIDCNENYCKRCTDTHIKMKATRTHSLINVDLSGNKRSVTKTLYCEKHPKEEVKVICKDCDTMLCLVCKLTDHEKHTSIDISNEANHAIDNIQQNVRKMYEDVTKLEDVEKRQRDTEKEVRKRKQRELVKVKQYEKKLEILLAKRTGNMEELVSKTFDNIVDEMSSSLKTTKKDILSTRNWALQIERMVEISDKVSLIEQSRALSKSFEKHVEKVGFYSKAVPENSLRQCQLSLSDDFLNNVFTPVVMTENVKVVSKISECKESKFCSSLSVYQKSCFAICGSSLCKADAPFSHFVDVERSSYYRNQKGLCVVRGDCYYSDGNEVKVWKQVDQKSKTFANFKIFPHGIAYRNRDDYEELLVCLNKHYSGGSEGLVRVVPLCTGQTEYNFFPETAPGPTRVAVNRTNGLVCLSYFCPGKISIHSEDGTLIQAYDYNYMGLSDSFHPEAICFDNEKCIIADMGAYDMDRCQYKQDGQVLRMNILGKVLQVLEKGCCPTAVAVSRDEKLWVGYWDKDVTVYQMSDVARKPDFCLCENKGTDQLCSNCTADQRLCFRYKDSTIPLLPNSGANMVQKVA